QQPAEVDPGTIGKLADITWAAVELQQWPRPIQDAVLREQAVRLVAQYRRDPQFADGVRWWKAGEIARLPLEQRDIILEASAIVAEEEYRTNPELTSFDAFGEEDLYVDSTNTELKPRDPPAAGPG